MVRDGEAGARTRARTGTNASHQITGRYKLWSQDSDTFSGHRTKMQQITEALIFWEWHPSMWGSRRNLKSTEGELNLLRCKSEMNWSLICARDPSKVLYAYGMPDCVAAAPCGSLFIILKTGVDPLSGAKSCFRSGNGETHLNRTNGTVHVQFHVFASLFNES